MDGATRRAAGVRPVRGAVRPAVGLGEVLLGILREYRRKQRFTPNHELRRQKIQKAARNKRRALARGRGE